CILWGRPSRALRKSGAPRRGTTGKVRVRYGRAGRTPSARTRPEPVPGEPGCVRGYLRGGDEPAAGAAARALCHHGAPLGLRGLPGDRGDHAPGWRRGRGPGRRGRRGGPAAGGRGRLWLPWLGRPVVA